MKTVIVAIAGLFASLSMAAGPPGFDAVAFNKLALHDRTEVTIAGLQTRDAALRNVDYEFVEREYQKKEGLPELQFGDHSWHIKRLNDQLWTHSSIHRGFTPPNGVVGSTAPVKYTTSLWDGSVYTAHAKEGRSEAGHVEDHVTSYIFDLDYNHMLGFIRKEVINPERPNRVDQWLIASARWKPNDAYLRKDLDIHAQTEDGTSIIYVTLSETITDKKLLQKTTEEYRIDPIKGFMICGHECTVSRDVPPPILHYAARVTASKEIDGAWFPTVVESMVETSSTPGKCRSYFELGSMKRNSVKPEDMKVEFPVGFEVLDSVKHRVYRVLADGKEQDIPYFNAASGRVLRPATTPATSPTR